MKSRGTERAFAREVRGIEAASPLSIWSRVAQPRQGRLPLALALGLPLALLSACSKEGQGFLPDDPPLAEVADQPASLPEKALSLPEVAGELPPGPTSIASPLPDAAVDQPAEASAGLTRLDSQGAVEFAVVPLNLIAPSGDQLQFEVSMNTHSMDLSMDLAGLSTLETDSGARVAAQYWSGGSGHHVTGVLVFPMRDDFGQLLLDGARTLTLRIVGVDAPLREFHWELALDP